jgi:dTDP-4-dehydrorhamnose 3,5-epimerase
MKIEPTALPGVMLVAIEPHCDQRGMFARTFDEAAFTAAGLTTSWPQCNISWNRKRGTLRGMHLQLPPCEEPKLVRVTCGRVLDVAIDLRRESPTFCRWIGIELSHQCRNALFIPGGFAHGFLTLEDDCEVFYMMGEIFVPEAVTGVRWNDPSFAIAWPFEPATMSERDASWADFAA